MKWLFVALVVLVASVAVGLAALPDPGYVLIGYGRYSVETSLLAFLVALAVVYSLLRFAARLWQVPRSIRRWNSRHQGRRLGKSFDAAVVDLAEGRADRAERKLARLVCWNDCPIDVYLTAARVANHMGAQDRRDHYLRLASQRYPKAQLAIALVQAELQLSALQLDQAQTTLLRLDALAAHNSRVTRLRMQLYLKQEDWTRLRQLLPELRHRQVLTADQWQRLAVQAYRQQLEELAARRDPDTLQASWARFPSSVQREAVMVSAYVQALLDSGAHRQAESVLREALQHGWSASLAYAYGDVAGPDGPAQLAFAEGWLARHPDHPVVLLTLGKISLRNELWGKARSYLQGSIDHGPTPEAYRLLGSLLERLEEPEKAAECYRRGMALAAARAGGVLPTPAQDAVALPSRPA